jgi:hypothetical protein
VREHRREGASGALLTGPSSALSGLRKVMQSRYRIRNP